MVIAVCREARNTETTEAVPGAAAALGMGSAGRLTATAAGSSWKQGCQATRGGDQSGILNPKHQHAPN